MGVQAKSECFVIMSALWLPDADVPCALIACGLQRLPFLLLGASKSKAEAERRSFPATLQCTAPDAHY